MPVVHPARYQTHPKLRRRKPFVFALLMIIFIVAVWNYLRPLPPPVATFNLTIPKSAQAIQIPWPTAAQVAVAAPGYGLLGTAGNQTPLSTASMTKVITALCVLAKQPIHTGQSGPTYTISVHDVDIYNQYVAQDGSVLQVVQGEKLTEYQAIEALLIPSANNIADSLVNWVFGSHEAYVNYATNFLVQNGLNNTHIGSDASGFDPSTTSTASDMTALGVLALKNPVIMQIAGQQSAVFPVVGTVANYNTVLGENGITGLKTGNNDADPGAFLFTSQVRIGDQNISLTGAVMGAIDLETALNGASNLSAALKQDFEEVPITGSSQTVGNLHTDWGTSSPIISTNALEVVRWKASPLSEAHTLNLQVREGTIGSLKVTDGQIKAETKLRLAHTVAGPSFWWRLTRH